MKKLWDKGYQIDPEIEHFTVGNDHYFDTKLISYDCLGSIAHAAMLKKIGILSDDEFAQIHSGLKTILCADKKKTFSIAKKDEDVHTAIEHCLVKLIGNAGKKLHTARSRNDQIALDIRLYAKQELCALGQSTVNLCSTLSNMAELYQDVPIPGQTHMQKAMPSSLGLWAGAYMETLLDNLLILKNAYTLIDQCPLGSAAGYGTALSIDRQYTADLLGFAKVQNNVLYASNSRGKFESTIIHTLAQMMNDLSRLSCDLILYSLPEFGYLSLPKEYCTGSSLMPQKQNPDALELVRSKAATVIGFLGTTLEITRGLPSGYNRDVQETKGPLMQALNITKASVKIINHIIAGITVNKESCLKACTSELFATDEALILAQKGMPFRDAYKKIAGTLGSVKKQDPVKNILSKTHVGSTGNLNLADAHTTCNTYQHWLDNEQHKWQQTVNHLIEGILHD